jgi:hypothetical protein
LDFLGCVRDNKKLVSGITIPEKTFRNLPHFVTFVNEVCHQKAERAIAVFCGQIVHNKTINATRFLAMFEKNCVGLCCRSCRYYLPEGRRGGHCQQLGVPVRGSWRTCSVARGVFGNDCQKLEKFTHWKQPEGVGV